MWKLIVGFIVFAALVLYVLKKSNADIDLSGEQHGTESAAVEPAASPSAAAAAASRASAPH